jgi:hypothetical protein
LGSSFLIFITSRVRSRNHGRNHGRKNQSRNVVFKDQACRLLICHYILLSRAFPMRRQTQLQRCLPPCASFRGCRLGTCFHSRRSSSCRSRHQSDLGERHL